MKGFLVSTLSVVGLLMATLVPITSAQADSADACNAYRLEIIELKAGLEQRYSSERATLMDKGVSPEERNAIIRTYTLDADNLRFRMLIDKFRADRPNECGWWRESDGRFN